MKTGSEPGIVATASRGESGRAFSSDDADERLEQALAEFRTAWDAGERIERELLYAKYPDVVPQLSECLDTMDLMAEFAPQVNMQDLPEGGDAGSGGPPRELGDFRLVREIGRGGMGVVYEAEQLSLPRRVALKVLPFAAILDKRQLQRFQNEARAAATLDHPGIVSVYSVGCERGVHYYAMPLIEGQTLADVILVLRQRMRVDSPVRTVNSSPAVSKLAGRLISDRLTSSSRGLVDGKTTAPHRESEGKEATYAAETVPVGRAAISTQQSTGSIDYCCAVARLGIQAAEALDYAHLHGVLHRDIKPANLMLDAEGKLWITDFGLARIEADAGMTVTGDILGTLRYMSPEQALAKRSVLDHRTDIYSLGVTLYEMLTLEPVVRGADREALLQQLAYQEPQPPCQINKAIPRDLETVVQKAICKDPRERYETAQEFADDLKRFLANEPINARRPSSLDRISKWMRRHRTLAWSMAAVLLVAVACLAVATAVIGGALQDTRWAQRQTIRERDAAFDNLYVANVRCAQQEWENGNLTAVNQLLDAHLPTDGRNDLRGWEWNYLKSLCHPDLATLRGHTAGIRTVAWSPDGQRLASAGDDFVVKVWDAATHEQLATLSGHRDVIWSVAWSPDGRQIASASWDKTVRIWDVASGATVVEIPAGDRALRHVDWSPDGSRLASCGDDSCVRVWDATTGDELLQMEGHFGVAWSVAWSPDGSHLVSVGNFEHREIFIWDAETGRRIRQILEAHDMFIRDVAWSPGGQQIATGSMDQTVRIWDAKTGEQRLEIDVHNGGVRSISWSPDGKELATAGEGGSVKIWNASDGRLLNLLRGHVGATWGIHWRPDGKRLASGSEDATVKIWDPHREQASMTVRGRGGFSWSPDGRRLASVVNHESDGQSQVLQIIDMESRAIQQLAFQSSDRSTIRGPMAWSPDGSRIACAARGSVTKVFDTATMTEIYSLEVPAEDRGYLKSLAWSPDARYLATSGFVGADEGDVVIWEMTTGEKVVSFRDDEGFDSVAWRPDGTQIAASRALQTVTVWEVASWREVRRLACHTDFPGDIAGGEHKVIWAPDGSWLAAGTAWGWLIVWDASTGREVVSFRAHTAAIRSIAVSPDGLRVATASIDRSVKIWDTTGRQLLTLRGHDGPVNSVAWSPRGTWLVSSGGDGVRVWGGSKDWTTD